MTKHLQGLAVLRHGPVQLRPVLIPGTPGVDAVQRSLHGIPSTAQALPQTVHLLSDSG